METAAQAPRTVDRPAPASRWIVSAPFDLALFFGGLVGSAIAFGLWRAGLPIVVLFWTWLLVFDGPHIGAAFTRTYVDRDEWRTRKGVLLLSLLCFAVGPVFLAATAAAGSPDPFNLFLAIATFYGVYHLVRQHYGFLALYKAKARDFDRVNFHVDKWFLYVGSWLPYFYFLLTHPRARVLLNLSVDPSPIERVAIVAVIALWSVNLLVFLVRAIPRLPQAHVVYALITVLFYALVYVAVGRLEPVYAPPPNERRSPDQDFLLIQVLITLPHNLQYLALMWFHNRNRYSGAGDFGPATPLNRTPLRFVAMCLLFSGVLYLAFACSTGVFPRCQLFVDARLGPVTFNQLGLCLWWGLALHHYVLDQKIWRIQGDAALKRNLGLA